MARFGMLFRSSRVPRSRIHPGLPWLLLAGGLVASFGVYRYALNEVSRRDALEFEKRMETVDGRFQSSMEQQITLLRVTAGAISLNPGMTPEAFGSFSRAIDLTNRFSGVLGVGFARRVDPQDRARFRREWPKIRIEPDRPQETQFPIFFIQPPIPRNLQALGFDMYSESIRRRSMNRARDTAEATATSRVVLRQDNGLGNPPGFLIYLPVYRNGAAPADVSQRRKDLVGFAYSPLRTEEFFGQAIPNPVPLDIGIEILLDGEPVFRFTPKGQERQEVFHRGRIDHQIAGRSWTIRCYAPRFDDAYDDSNLIRFGPYLGLLITFLLFLLVRAQGRILAETAAGARRAERAAERERLLAEAGRILAGSLDSERTLDRIAGLAVPDFADWCAVDVKTPSGDIERISLHHPDPEFRAFAQAQMQRRPMSPDDGYGAPKVIQTGKAEHVHAMTEEVLASYAKDAGHLEAMRSLRLKSVMIVPVTVRGETVAAITFASSNSERIYDESDLALAHDIAARTAVAWDNARLYEAAQREIAERRRAESQVRLLNSNLERLVEERTKELKATNSELEAFCYSVSHDLRTPLRGVDGFSRALAEDYGKMLPSEGLGYLERIRSAARRMDELITALLTLSRITRADISPAEIDVTALVNEVAAEERGAYSAEVQIEIQNGMTAHADERMLRIVFTNLIANALKFSSPQPRPVIEIGLAPTGVFFVRDNGVGFNPEYISKLFSPFERLHTVAEFPGTGVGLATVQRIVQRHGGEVWAISQEGQGATFYFRLS